MYRREVGGFRMAAVEAMSVARPPPALPLPDRPALFVRAVSAGPAFAVYWFVLRGPKPKTVTPSADQPRTLVLSKTPGDLHFTAFKDAAAASRPGDRIVVQDDEWEEVVTLSGIKGLTVTAAEGKRVVWRVPAKANPMAILSLHNAENVRIAGISFQAGGRAENVLRLTGSQSFGLVLEDVE